MGIQVAKKRRGRERGSSLVEFSLVLLPLLALLFLALDLAWLLFAWASIQEGVREGVRFAITGKTDAQIIAVVQQYSFGFSQNPRTASVQVNYYSASNPSTLISATGSSCSGNIVKVSVSGVSINPLIPLWRNKAPISLSGAAADMVELNSVCR